HVASLEDHFGLVESLAFTPDSKFLATAGQDYQVLLWRSATDDCVAKLEGHQGTVWDVAWSGDGKTLGSASEDQTVNLWDLASPEEWLTSSPATASVADLH
ncbi:MAG TPA: hypothetical protein VGZ25_13820, partial [Gemmataceae bacterium]|nr:hypothetical protein [Gemmataceae bacterium]